MDACKATKDKFVKIGALNTALKITVEQFHIGQELGFIEKQPLEIQNLSYPYPFTCDPEMKRLLIEGTERQKQEKAKADAARQLQS